MPQDHTTGVVRGDASRSEAQANWIDPDKTPICSAMMQKSDPWDSQPSCALILLQFASPFPLHLNLA
jgi:hypothetical protein